MSAKTARIGLLVFVVAGAGFGQDFTSVFQERARASHGIAGKEYVTAAFGDYNNDGFLDLAMTTNERSVYVYKNDPANPGHFTQVLSQEGPDRQVAWADYDNDTVLMISWVCGRSTGA